MSFAHTIKVPLRLLVACFDFAGASFGTMTLAQSLRFDRSAAINDFAEAPLVFYVTCRRRHCWKESQWVEGIIKSRTVQHFERASVRSFFLSWKILLVLEVSKSFDHKLCTRWNPLNVLRSIWMCSDTDEDRKERIYDWAMKLNKGTM